MEREVDWSPKPFHFLNCWKDVLGYRKFVENTWVEALVQGRSAYVLKEKLKHIKHELHTWNKNHCGIIEQMLDTARKELERLEEKQD